MNESPELRAVLEGVCRRLADEGKLVEAGWVALRLTCIPAGAPEAQLREMRIAFMSGAHHLFTSCMMTLDEGDEATLADMRRMDKIAKELDAFLQNELKPLGAKGKTILRKM